MYSHIFGKYLKLKIQTRQLFFICKL